MRSERLTKHFVYWMLPLLVMLPCIFIYFYNWQDLSKFIAPDFNREFGLIENLQLALILTIFITALKGFRRKKGKTERYAYLLLAFASAFVFLEEIDYGLHYYEFMIGKTKTEVDYQIVVEGQVRNIHNMEHVNSAIKFMVYCCTVIFFVVLPLLPKKTLQRFALAAYLAPSRYIIGTAIALLLINHTAQYMDSIFHEQNIALHGNTSEFEEVMNYYIFLLFAREMVNKKQPAADQKWNLAYLCGYRPKSQE